MKSMSQSILFFMLSLFFLNPVLSADFIENNWTGFFKTDNPLEARKQIQDEAIEKLSEEQIKNLIGPEAFDKNKALITSKIYKNPGRYIPFIKVTDPKPGNDGFTMTVFLKLSPSNLRTLLQELGIGVGQDVQPIVFPVIQYVDKVNSRTYRWWTSDVDNGSVFLATLSRKTEAALSQQFQKNGLFLQRPEFSKMVKGLSEGLKKDRWSMEDMNKASTSYESPLVLDGQMTITPSTQKSNAYRFELKFEIIQAQQNRTIADIVRVFETEAGPFEAVVDKKLTQNLESLGGDLATQISDALQSGSLSAHRLNLSFRNGMTPLQIEALKSKLKLNNGSIRSIRERRLSSQATVFEIDSSESAQSLALKLNSFDFENKKAKIISVSESEVSLQF